MNLFFHIREEKVFYLLSGKNKKEIGEISVEDLDDFLKDRKVKSIYFIFSKPEIYFRKLEFEFKDLKKINLILPQEIEGKVPGEIKNFLFYKYEYFPDNTRTFINIFCIEKTKIDFWYERFKKYKINLYFFIDSIILHQFFHNKISDKDFVEIFIEGNYILLNLIENSEISGTYSYISDNPAEAVKELLIPIISTKNLPGYIICKKEIFDKIEIPLKLFSEVNFFDIVENIKKLKPVYFKPILYSEKKLNFEFILYFLFLIATSIFFANPYFKKIEKEKKLNEINSKMENVFKSIFPETKKIVNPLIQIKEKMKNEEGFLKFEISDISVIKLLEEITLLFPENIQADVEEVNFAGNTVSLTGTIDSLKNLDRVKENIKKSKIFNEFEIGDISFTKDNKVKFNLSLKMGEK